MREKLGNGAFKIDELESLVEAGAESRPSEVVRIVPIVRGARAPRRRILVVDGALPDAPWLERDLLDLGADVVVAPSVPEAFALLRSGAPGHGFMAVIAGYGGDRDSMSGLVFLELVAQDFPHVRRLLACAPGAGYLAERRSALASAADAVVGRPWTLESLRRALQIREPL